MGVADPCAVPGYCDDKNACTKDTCDKVKGCVSTALADAPYDKKLWQTLPKSYKNTFTGVTAVFGCRRLELVLKSMRNGQKAPIFYLM